MLLRGLNVVVLNEVTGVVMSSRWYDTYESKADSGLLVKYLKGLRQGRIVCFAVKVKLINLSVSCLDIKHFSASPEQTNVFLRTLDTYSARKTSKRLEKFHSDDVDLQRSM